MKGKKKKPGKKKITLKINMPFNEALKVAFTPKKKKPGK